LCSSTSAASFNRPRCRLNTQHNEMHVQASAMQTRHDFIYVGPQLDTHMYGDMMFPEVPMVFMNPIAIARLELERANVLLIHVSTTTFATCACAMKRVRCSERWYSSWTWPGRIQLSASIMQRPYAKSVHVSHQSNVPQ